MKGAAMRSLSAHMLPVFVLIVSLVFGSVIAYHIVDTYDRIETAHAHFLLNHLQ
jgi:hypothetical protein